MSHTKVSLGRELLIAVIAIILSVVILPGVIYLVGTRLFGTYGGANGVAGLYAATLGDLSVPRMSAWIIVLGPAVGVVALRLIIKLTQHNAPERPAAPTIRREPTVQG